MSTYPTAISDFNIVIDLNQYLYPKPKQYEASSMFNKKEAHYYCKRAI